MIWTCGPGTHTENRPGPRTGHRGRPGFTIRRMLGLVIGCSLAAASCASTGGGEPGRGADSPRQNGVTTSKAVPELPSSTTEPEPVDLDIIQRAMTSSEGGFYHYETSPVTVRVSAPPDPGGAGVREMFWETGSLYAANQESCITWDTTAFSNGDAPTQPGLAVRITPSGKDGHGIEAISVNQNVWSAASWIIWVNTSDTSRPGRANTPVAAFDVSAITGKRWTDENGWHNSMIGPPWYVCARTEGLQFTFKLWTHQDTEPGWDDPDHVFTTTLPEGWDHPGYSGGYIGHLRENQTASFSRLSSTPLCSASDEADPAA